MTGSAVYPFGQAQPDQSVRRVRVPDRTWTLDGGWGWVYYAPGHDQLQQPIIMSDGFHLGESDRTALYWGFENNGEFALITELNQRGYDVIVLGYRDCSRSILANAETATQCIWQAIAESVTDTPLVVGGFSMGGLVTRYALARMELLRMDHRVSHYFSYDTPHLGAWVPISLQSLAWYIRPTNSALADLVDSDAARQMLWKQKTSLAADPEEHEERRKFLAELARLGDWPARPVKIGVANGRGDGQGNGNPAGEIGFQVTQGLYYGTELYIQGSGDPQQVAKLRTIGLFPADKYTPGYPELDSVAGGTLDSFAIAAATISAVAGQQAVAPYPDVNFIPTISALAVTGTDIGDPADLALNVDALDDDRFELDLRRTSSANTGHTAITRELCEFILEQLPKR
ncbi:esterase/lipase family protein [Longispora urticae]